MMTADAVLYAARFAAFGAAAIMFGWSLFSLYGGCGAPPAPRIWAWIGLIASLVWAAQVFLSVTGGSVDAAAWVSVLFGAGFGLAWLAHLACSTTLTLLPRRRASFAAIAGANLASIAGLGHANVGGGALALIHLVTDGLHLLAAGAWLGGLFPLAHALAQENAAQRALRGFSRMGYGAVTIVVLTGVANTRLATGRFLPDPATAYGALLTAKIAVVAGLIAVAAFNRLVASRPGKTMLFAISLPLEQALFAIVLGLVAAFGEMAPA